MSVYQGFDAEKVDGGLESFVETYCPHCGQECGEDATWCSYFDDGRTPVTPVRVRWSPEVIEGKG